MKPTCDYPACITRMAIIKLIDGQENLYSILEDVAAQFKLIEDELIYQDDRIKSLQCVSRRPIKKRGEVKRRAVDKSLIHSIKVKKGYKCEDCGLETPGGVGLDIHHIIPIFKGGGNNVDNLRLLCAVCHRKTHLSRIVSAQEEIIRRLDTWGAI